MYLAVHRQSTSGQCDATPHQYHTTAMSIPTLTHSNHTIHTPKPTPTLQTDTPQNTQLHIHPHSRIILPYPTTLKSTPKVTLTPQSHTVPHTLTPTHSHQDPHLRLRHISLHTQTNRCPYLERCTPHPLPQSSSHTPTFTNHT